ncbi:MAG: ribosomal RNA small subunit methyltransferase A [Candidatus Zixiibacteriota bacterium]|nr:MAG: ribosomal RNA small subunit methyltransferase A [candidate division Zixibacteria bacterium]
MGSYRAKKRLGQNFLESQIIIDKLMEVIAPQRGERIIEIGPGRGALTLSLASAKAQIATVEYDKDLIGYLSKLLRGYDNVEIIHADFLKYEPAYKSFKLVGNIPYNITSPVIEWAVAHSDSITAAYLMVQKEMADRLGSAPGSKSWCPMAIFTQLHFDIDICFDVAAKHFRPPPKVISAVIRLTPREPAAIEDYGHFERLVRTSFGHRRKTLVNNLVPELTADRQKVVEALGSLGLTEKARAEQISTGHFLALTKLLAKHNIFRV